MSRIGKQPITLPDGIKFNNNNSIVTVENSSKKLELKIPKNIQISEKDGSITVSPIDETKTSRAFHGTIRSLINNMVEGLHKGFKKQLEINGVGFKAEVKGENLNLSIGFSHPVNHAVPKELKVNVEKNTLINIEGYDKQLVGQFAADIRSYYPPEPYKGKGIKYVGEHIRRKVGKSVK